jgi:hypothetical protein
MDKNAIRQKLTDPAVNAVGWEQVPERNSFLCLAHGAYLFI